MKENNGFVIIAQKEYSTNVFTIKQNIYSNLYIDDNQNTFFIN